MIRFLSMCTLVALAAAAPLQAQGGQVSRGRYTFVNTRLSIEVTTDLPGLLRVMHGAVGEVDVTARAPGGLVTSSLGGRTSDVLHITALGGRRLDAIVSVPPQVWVNIHVPGSGSAAVFSGLNDTKTYHWGPASERENRASAPLPPPDSDGLYTLDTGSSAPAEVSISGASSLESVSVHLGEPGYSVRADAPIETTSNPGITRLRVTDSAGRPARVIVDVPGRTRAFTLRLNEAAALVVSGGRVRSICGTSVTDQWLSGNRRWVTFSPPRTRPQCAIPMAASRTQASGH